MDTITSRKNAIVSAFREAARGRHSHDSDVLLDGPHLVEEALASGARIHVCAFAQPRLMTHAPLANLAQTLETAGVRVVLVPNVVMTAMSPVRTPSGVVALAARPAADVHGALEHAPQLVVVAISIQDPGNLGAIIRVADAVGATAVIACGDTADPFGWKALRGSMGSAFRVPIGLDPDPHAVVARLHARGIRVLAAVPRAGRTLYRVDLTGPVAIMLGREGEGLPSDFARLADETITIPMRPGVESLNVATTAAVVMYEAIRQRSNIESLAY